MSGSAGTILDHTSLPIRSSLRHDRRLHPAQRPACGGAAASRAGKHAAAARGRRGAARLPGPRAAAGQRCRAAHHRLAAARRQRRFAAARAARRGHPRHAAAEAAAAHPLGRRHAADRGAARRRRRLPRRERPGARHRHLDLRNDARRGGDGAVDRAAGDRLLLGRRGAARAAEAVRYRPRAAGAHRPRPVAWRDRPCRARRHARRTCAAASGRSTARCSGTCVPA